MRFIDMSDLRLPDGWEDEAQACLDALEAAQSKDERDQIIDDNQRVWKALRDALSDVSHGKCWFSEARDLFSHFDVEHFRPKKSAKDLNKHERDGYWWLSFVKENLRLCGNVGNRKKGTFFPLRDGSFCACAEDRRIEEEVPYLLDPACPADPLMIAFNSNGRAVPTPGIDAWQAKRADVSIERYKLFHDPLQDARRRVWTKCQRGVNHCQNMMQSLDDAGGAVARARLEDEIARLREMVLPDTPLSAVAICCLLNSGIGWAARIAAQN